MVAQGVGYHTPAGASGQQLIRQSRPIMQSADAG